MSFGAGLDIEATDYVIQVVAGEALSARDSVYIKTSDGKAYKTDADDLTTLGFVGFVITAVSSGATVNILTWGVLTGFTGLVANTDYWVSGTSGEITATKPSNFKYVGRALNTTTIRITTSLTKRMRVYTLSSLGGASGTRFDITNPAGTTFRYTWDGTGDDPGINSGTVPIGTLINIKAQNFTAANNGSFITTGVGANYFEITNASGVAENDKTLGTGYLDLGYLWTKPGGLSSVEVELVGGGGGGSNCGADDAGAGGGGAGYSRKIITASSLGSTENVLIGRGGAIETSGDQSSFGSHLSATGGSGASGNTPGSAGVGSNGDLNLKGQGGGNGETTNGVSGGVGGSSHLGGGGKPGDPTAEAGGNYGGGGGGAYNVGSGSSTGGVGASGIVIVTEYY